MRPGQRYISGDTVVDKMISHVHEEHEEMDKIRYMAIYNECEHYVIVSHKTLARAEITGVTGKCMTCVKARLEHEKEEKRKRRLRRRRPPKPRYIQQDPILAFHLSAHLCFATAYQKAPYNAK